MSQISEHCSERLRSRALSEQFYFLAIEGLSSYGY